MLVSLILLFPIAATTVERHANKSCNETRSRMLNTVAREVCAVRYCGVERTTVSRRTCHQEDIR